MSRAAHAVTKFVMNNGHKGTFFTGSEYGFVVASGDDFTPPNHAAKAKVRCELRREKIFDSNGVPKLCPSTSFVRRFATGFVRTAKS